MANQLKEILSNKTAQLAAGMTALASSNTALAQYAAAADAALQTAQDDVTSVGTLVVAAVVLIVTLGIVIAALRKA